MRRAFSEFSRSVKRQAYEASGGLCAMCRLPITGRAEYDHNLPVELGGEGDLSNCQVLCQKCHRLKTTGDIRGIRKADRQRDKASGAKRSKSTMPGSRSSKWKRKMDGTVVRRNDG